MFVAALVLLAVLTDPELMFMKQMAEMSHAEIGLATLAKERSKNPEVLRVAEEMIRDHSKMNETLKSTADKENVGLPTGPNVDRMPIESEVRTLHGDAFDREWVRIVIKDHEDLLGLIKSHQTDIAHASLVDLVADSQKRLEHHLELARSLEKKLTTGSR